MIELSECVHGAATSLEVWHGEAGESLDIVPAGVNATFLLQIISLLGNVRVLIRDKVVAEVSGGEYALYRISKDAAVQLRASESERVHVLISQIGDSLLDRSPDVLYIPDFYVLMAPKPMETLDLGGSEEMGLKHHELHRVYRVRNILRSQPGESYTLIGLAHEVGTNDATLKKHFKQVIGCTVFAYLRRCRMEAARVMLVEEKLPIAEIGLKLGYKHVSHFSAAFRKYFGCAPTKFNG